MYAKQPSLKSGSSGIGSVAVVYFILNDIWMLKILNNSDFMNPQKNI